MSLTKRPRRYIKRTVNSLPKFTIGLETRLVKVLGKPVDATRRYLRNHLEDEQTYTEPNGTRYVYTKRLNLHCLGLETLNPNTWNAVNLYSQQGIITDIDRAICRRDTKFQVELVVREERLRSFHFALSMEQV